MNHEQLVEEAQELARGKMAKRVSNKQIWSEVGRLADEMDEANGRQRELTKELITIKTRQEECPIWKGGKLNDPRVMLGLISAVVAIFEIISWVK